jgi:hypothetical protein
LDENPSFRSGCPGVIWTGINVLFYHPGGACFWKPRNPLTGSEGPIMFGTRLFSTVFEGLIAGFSLALGWLAAMMLVAAFVA